MQQFILAIEDEPTFLANFELTLKKRYEHVTGALTGKAGLEIIRNNEVDVVLLDIRLPDAHGIEILKEIKKHNERIEVIMVSASEDIKEIVNCMKIGACDFISKPVDYDELFLAIDKALEKRRLIVENRMLHEKLEAKYKEIGLIYTSKKMQNIIDTVKKYKGSKDAVLVTGESGVGKELIARALYEQEKENNPYRPFEDINCATFDQNLILSELFGHVKGAYTGAEYDRPGRFELANSGDIFLDEIGELKLDLQAKLLRILDTKTVKRIGGTKNLQLDFRVIAATNRNLESDIEHSRFRSDLYARINVFSINIPPLRERKEDIPLLTKHFVKKYSIDPKKITDSAIELLMSHNWPLNVRELENTIKLMLVITRGKDTITADDVPLPVGIKTYTILNQIGELSLNEIIEKTKKLYVLKALDKYNSSVKDAANSLQIPEATLYRYIKELDIER
jgi:DNA-binding NtrC family response regulator